MKELTNLKHEFWWMDCSIGDTFENIRLFPSKKINSINTSLNFIHWHLLELEVWNFLLWWYLYLGIEKFCHSKRSSSWHYWGWEKIGGTSLERRRIGRGGGDRLTPNEMYAEKREPAIHANPAVITAWIWREEGMIFHLSSFPHLTGSHCLKCRFDQDCSFSLERSKIREGTGGIEPVRGKCMLLHWEIQLKSSRGNIAWEDQPEGRLIFDLSPILID